MYPLNTRDLLLWFAHHDLFKPKWSNHIFSEWEEVMRRKGVDEESINRRIAAPTQAFPDALVTNYEPIIKSVNLPDKDDCHVLAAAIKANVNVIITENLKDFPASYLAEFSLSAKNADDFATDIIDLNQEVALEAFFNMTANRTKPQLDHFQMLDSLRKSGLNDTADYLHSLI